jgi:hypothetical protein
MTVIDQEPKSWYLVRDGDSLFLDVRCSSQLADFSIAIRLEPEESENYAVAGHAYVADLAHSVSSGPSRFYSRRVSNEDQGRVDTAILASKEKR